MFELLTRVLLWVLIVTILWYIFSQFINKTYLTWLGGLILFSFLILAFLTPGDTTVGLVWSVLSLPLKPLGLTLFLLLNALREGTKKIVANQVVAALMVLFFASTPIVAYWLTAQTERSAFSTVEFQGERAADPATVQAIIVLGDGTSPADPTYGVRTQINNRDDSFGTGLMSRLLYAAQFYQEQAAQNNQPLVIVSPGLQPFLSAQEVQPNNVPPEAQAVSDVLINAGVPPDRILVDLAGVDVRSSAIEVERLLVERGFQKNRDTIVLLAPALTIRRASSAFAQVGLQPLPRPTDFFAFQLSQDDQQLAILSNLIPNVEALALTTRAVDEYLTSIYYFLRGWLLNPVTTF